ncbi:MAG TPA: beta-ketoacyl-ACP synthase III [Pirellulales bacterium]|jgi:3-oxoacyl-[acyl-carrier-protein] synthase-3|nr:beta-ketoacyl-ACP synthase III [Pirellulales bacterium]
MTDFSEQNLHAPVRRLTGVRVVGVGSYVPEKIVRNEDLVHFGCDPEWILRRTGIHERRHAPPEMATSDLAAIAAERCIARAGLAKDDIDLIVLGTFTPDMTMPATACLVQHKMGICAPAMDVQAACAGFFYALATAMQFVATGCSKLALAIGADCNSRVIDPQDVKTYPLFGDGAGAVLLAAGQPTQGFAAYAMGADGSGFDLLNCPMGGSRLPASAERVEQRLQYLKMYGKPVFKWAVRLLAYSIREVLSAAKMTIGDVDLFLLHQANARILDAVAEELKIDPAKMPINLDRYGNTSSGSIPLALDECLQQDRIHPGSNLLISGFGGGLAWGTGLFRW